MSEAALRPAGGLRRWLNVATGLRVALVVVVAALPLYLNTSLEQTGLFAFSAIIGAIGLNLLTGTAGQLSLAHAFFVSIGAYGYAYLAAPTHDPNGGTALGVGLPPLLAMVVAVLAAGVAGLLFSPISSRLRGIYLGVASISLVFLGQHVLFNASTVTGGFNGRNVRAFDLFGFSFSDHHPDLTVLGTPYGHLERLWYLGLVLVVLSYVFAKNVLRGRPGRALEMVRDSETAAAVMGVDVRRYKAAAFVLSSMYAGLAGVFFGLAFSRIVPDSFGFDLSINYLAMIVIGGLGSVGGAALGAVFVSALPQLLVQYSSDFPFLSQPGSGGVDAGTFARFVYGAAIVLVVLFEPGGIAATGRRITGRRRRRAQLSAAGLAPPAGDREAARAG